jgi:hypothetical protein
MRAIAGKPTIRARLAAAAVGATVVAGVLLGAAPAHAADKYWGYTSTTSVGCSSVTGMKVGGLAGAGYKILAKSSICKKYVAYGKSWWSTNLYYR